MAQQGPKPTLQQTPLLKALTDAGVGSRRGLADAIRQGRVEVNGTVVDDFRHPLNLQTDRVSLDKRQVDLRPLSPAYLLVHKPGGVLSTTSDSRGRTTVIDILPDRYRRLSLHLVGRLDKDSTGLLLLTNDGELTYHLTHPSFEHEREYLVAIDGTLTSDEKQRLERGVVLEDGVTHPTRVSEVRAQPFNYSMIMHEGRKRQVRRMFQSLGYRVTALKRVRMGTLKLGSLAEGKVRDLSPGEVRELLQATTLARRHGDA